MPALNPAELARKYGGTESVLEPEPPPAKSSAKPVGSIATRHNNPLNIKYGGATKHWVERGEAEVGEGAKDKGNFLKFRSPESGWQAAQELLTSPVYSNLTVDAALRKWSNKGYGAEITTVPRGVRISQLKPEQQREVLSAMAVREGFEGADRDEGHGLNPEAIAKKYGGTVTTAGVANKYGGTVSDVSPARPVPPSAAEAPETWDQWFYRKTKEAAGLSNIPLAPQAVELGTGALKGLGSSAYGLSRMVPGLRQLMPPEKPEFLQPQTTSERIGYTGEQIGEFFVPGTAGEKVAAKLPAVSKAVSIPARAALEAAGAYGVSRVQGLTSEEAAAPAAVAAGTALAMPGILKALGSVGRGIQTRLLSPTAHDISEGFNIRNIQKHGLGASTVAGVAQKTGEKLTQLSQDLRTALATTPGDIDVLKHLIDAIGEVQGQPVKTFGINKKLQTAANSLLDELQSISPSGRLSVADTNDLKRATGQLGSWSYGMRDPESTAMQKIANAYYTKLRRSVEHMASRAGQDVAAINSQIKEIIPIERLLLRRVPQLDKQALLSLTDVITLHNPSNWWLFVANRMGKSMRSAQAMVRASESSGGGSRTVRSLGAAARQVQPQSSSVPQPQPPTPY